MANIAPGATFTTGHNLTPSDLHTSVEGSHVTGLDLDDFATLNEIKLIQAGAGRPTDDQGQGSLASDWENESFRTLIADGANWHDMAKGYPYLTNAQGVTIPLGSVCVSNLSVGQAGSIDFCVTIAYPDVMGIAGRDVESTSPLQDGKLITNGFAQVRVQGPLGPGEHLISSSGITGVAIGDTLVFTTPTGQFTLGIGFGMALMSLGSIATDMTCLIWIE